MLRRLRPDQVVVTGRPDDVSMLITKAVGRGNSVSEKRGLQMSHASRNLRLGLIQAAVSGKPWSVSDLMVTLAKVARDERLNVGLEPNCAVGYPYTQEINPWEWAVNPWEWAVNPWEWAVNPDIPRVISIGTSPADGEARFWTQPALATIGLTELGQRSAALANHQGAGVMVGIFDALPTQPVSQPWLTLHASTIPLESPDSDLTRDVSDHGLMCASLVHAVAPAAQVHLYEVCTKEGYGDLYPLLAALTDFIDMAAGHPAVISLSLGSLCCGSPSPAMQAVLQRATDLGMVVCAAAGNRGKSASKPCNLGAAQVPAALPNVIAVSASSLTGTRATYSLRGDIAAPGGED
ncbi:MAG TPA: S8 family serine peptidase, partial [Symbiobacteriaceae bacterium]|nr:S8 family serine peptidase [Symbiobacteriaceae bacterium]